MTARAPGYTCEHCVHARIRVPTPGAEEVRCCTAVPPRPMMIPGENGPLIIGVFPPVRDDDYCNQFEGERS